MQTAVTVPPYSSRIARAASRAWRSSGLKIAVRAARLTGLILFGVFVYSGVVIAGGLRKHHLVKGAS